MASHKAQKGASSGTAEIQELDPMLLTLDPDVQPRERVVKTLVQQYSEDMKAGDRFPPVMVFSDPSTHWVADGFHRVAAAIEAKLPTIKVEVREGGKRDAILWAAGCNATHGLPRTNKDKRRAVERLLSDKQWERWPDREIARRCRVSNTFVSKLKKELSVNGSQMDGTRLVTRGGKTYKMDTANIGSQGADDEQRGEDGDQEREEPGSGALDSDEHDHQPDTRESEPSESEDGSDDEAVEDALVGAQADSLSVGLHAVVDVGKEEDASGAESVITAVERWDIADTVGHVARALVPTDRHTFLDEVLEALGVKLGEIKQIAEDIGGEARETALATVSSAEPADLRRLGATATGEGDARYTLLHDDSLCALGDLPDDSVQLIMTSPPYADRRKRTYGGPLPDKYVEWFLPIAAELKRVLAPDGTFILNIKESVVDGQRHRYVHHLIDALVEEQGWLWTEEFAWHKRNCTPGKWPNRFRDA